MRFLYQLALTKLILKTELNRQGPDFFVIDLELNFACYKFDLVFLLRVEPYSRPLAKCFVTPGI